MPFYYVPVLMVIEAESIQDSLDKTDDILSALINLEPRYLDGTVTIEDQVEITLTQSDWEKSDPMLEPIENQDTFKIAQYPS